MKERTTRIRRIGYIMALLHLVFWLINMNGLAVVLEKGFFREEDLVDSTRFYGGVLPLVTARAVNYGLTYIYFICLVLLLVYFLTELVRKKRCGR